MAKRAEMPSAIVLTGETTEEDLAGEPKENLPDYTLERIDQLVPRDLWDEFGWRMYERFAATRQDGLFGERSVVMAEGSYLLGIDFGTGSESRYLRPRRDAASL